MGKEIAVIEQCSPLAIKQRQQAATFDLIFWQLINSGNGSEGGKNINVGTHGIEIAPGLPVTVPAHKERHSHSTFISTTFLTFHPRVIMLHLGVIGQLTQYLTCPA